MNFVFVVEQFSRSTAEDEVNYFTGQQISSVAQPTASLPDGIYRLIDGRLYQIVKGAPLRDADRP